MGIRFLCHACDRKLNVKSFLAGKKGICPHCGASVRIPTESQIPSRKELLAASQGAAPANGYAEQEMGESISIATTSEAGSAAGSAQVPATPTAAVATPVAAPARTDPIDENPDAIWYVRPPSGGQYGPADGDVMRRWISEKRVSAEGLVWREGWPEWKKGGEVFPQLTGAPMPPADTTPAAAVPDVASGSNSAPETAASGESPSSYAARARKKKKGAGIMAIVILGLLIAVLAVTLVVIVVNKS